MRYDPNRGQDIKAWLDLDEDERTSLVMDYHRRARIKLPNPKVHALAHMIVENQVALGDDYPVAAALERLMGEGLDRHEAIHAIGFVLMANIFDIQQGRIKGEVNEVYVRELAGLTAEKWRSEA
jgi:hypothetical protein